MSSNYRTLVFTMLSVCLFGQTIQADQNVNITHDLFTIVGLDREINQDYAQSGPIFESLFEKTKNTEDLKKAIDSYLRDQKMESVYRLSKENLEKFPQIEEYLMTQYLLAGILLKKYDEVLPIAQTLESKYTSPIGRGLIGDLYYVLGDFAGAKRNYLASYKELKSENLLLALVNLLYNDLNEKKEAIKHLEEFVKNGTCEELVCRKLLEWYQNDNNLSGMIFVMEKIYQKHKDGIQREKLGRIEAILAELYIQLDPQKGIEFLEQTKNNQLLLVSLYESKKEHQNALRVLEEIYLQTGDKKLFGRIAMNKFSLARNKKKIIQEVLRDFEIALKEGSNHEYENYYGYLLIDYDLDIKKGLSMVRKASEADPTNLAYIDSVAWGYYKNNQCGVAFEYINEVVKKAGLKDEEIALHYKKIKECKEKGSKTK